MGIPRKRAGLLLVICLGLLAPAAGRTRRYVTVCSALVVYGLRNAARGSSHAALLDRLSSSDFINCCKPAGVAYLLTLFH